LEWDDVDHSNAFFLFEVDTPTSIKIPTLVFSIIYLLSHLTLFAYKKYIFVVHFFNTTIPAIHFIIPDHPKYKSESYMVPNAKQLIMRIDMNMRPEVVAGQIRHVTSPFNNSAEK
jgi:hypothetical protein